MAMQGYGRPDYGLDAIEHEVMAMKAQLAMSQQDSGFSNRMPMPGGAMATSMTSFQQGPPTKEHQDLIEFNRKLMTMYNQLCMKHMALMEQCSNQLISRPMPKMGGGGRSGGAGLKKAACLGVIRLDYDYPPAPGDIDCPDSFGYDVYYRVVPGLTFSMCQSGKLTPEVEANFGTAIDYLISKGVTGITGDCGFMMYMQRMARQKTTRPVFMSSLAQLPAVTCAFNSNELILIMTANGKTLAPMRSLIKDECGVDTDERRYVIVGAENVPGFEAVAEGGKVNVEKVTPGMVQLIKETLMKYPKIRAICFECTELPPYSDAVRAATGLPVYDSITCCDFFINGAKDNERFGIQNWQAGWDGQQANYTYGANLTEAEKARLVNKCD